MEWPVLTSAAQWLKLTGNEASRGHPLRLEGMITLVDSSRNLIVLQDATGAVGINVNLRDYSLQPGQRIILDGNNAASYSPAFPDYPNRPSQFLVCNSFETETNWDLWYSSRLRGFLQPPVSGDYTFWIASDNSSELWLSTDTDPAHAQSIAQVRSGRLIFTQPREWNKYPTQQSPPVHLEAGQRYYIEAVHEQATGAANLSVAWQGPGLPQAVIDGRYLLPWSEAAEFNPAGPVVEPTHGILCEYWSNYFVGSVKPLTARRKATPLLTVRNPKLTVLGAGNMPEPHRFQPDEELNPADNFAWGEWEGDVTFAARDGDLIHLEMIHGSRRLTVRILDAQTPVPVKWREGRIRIRGVGEMGLNGPDQSVDWQVWVPSVQQVTSVASSESTARSARLISICQLTPANPEVAWGRRVRVRGKVLRQTAMNQVLIQGDDSFHGYVSSDAVQWNEIGVPVEIAMTNRIQSGLAVASFEPFVLATATFDEVAGLSNELENVDILRFPITAGRGSFKDSVYRVQGAGRGVRTDSDQLHYYYQPLAIDGEIVARVKSFECPFPLGLAGVMMRASAQQNAAFASVLVSGTNQVSFQFRRQSSALAEGVWEGNHPLPCWVKLVRRHETAMIHLAAGQTVTNGQELEVAGRLEWEAGQPVLREAGLEEIAQPEGAVVASGEPLDSGADMEAVEVRIRDLIDESGSRARQTAALRIRGVVTFYGRVLGRDYMVVQDDASAIFVSSLPGRRNSRPLRLGQRVELEGSRLDGASGPMFMPFSLNILGSDRLPLPVVHPGEFSFPRHGEGLWTQVEGVVHAVDAAGGLLVQTRQEMVVARLPQVAASQLKSLVDTRVQMRGVMTRTEAGGPLLLVPSLAYLEANDSPPENAFQLAKIATSEVKAFQNSAEPAHRVKVAGTVNCRRDDFLFVQDAAGGVRIRTAEVPTVAVGDQVEAVGFPQAGVPAGLLVNGLVRRTGDGVLPAPVPVSVAQLAEGKHEGVVVQLKATVLDQRSAPGDQVLELQAGERFFQATLPALPDRLPEIPVGSVVQVAGVCWGAVAAPVEDATVAGNLPKTFKLFLRSPADVSLLQRPPWWTWKHTAGMVVGLLLILAAALLWIRQLHQRVAARTQELETAMVRLNQETQTSATLAERERLAAEIHDGLQQGLSGIMLQLEGAAAKLMENPNFVRSSLEMARNMVVFCLSEVRHSVLNLQSPLVTEAGLGAALNHIGRQMSAGRVNEIRVEISGAMRPLPPAVEHHLFRIGQEALNNAIKHARADHITVELIYAEDSVRLAVNDDGCGFVVADVMGAGGEHLGVRTLRGRARKLGGRLSINSQSGRGTTVEVVVPTSPPPKPAI